MLEELHIKDFALIKELQISFGSGLNIITGETGAGKSILLGALNLVLGSKATTDLIRSGSKRSIVQGIFYLSNKENSIPVFALLENHGLETEENTLILRREINIEGRGRSFINSTQVPVGLLKKIGRYLVDIHGQNEHQNILNISTHRKILDRYAGLKSQVLNIYDEFKKRETARNKLNSISLNEQEKERRLEILKHEIDEIENANLDKKQEFEDLSSQEKTLANAESILQDISQAHMSLQDSDMSILNQLSSIENILEKNSEFDNSIHEVLNKFRESYFLLEDVSTDLRNLSDKIYVSPEELNEIRERLDILQNVMRKYGPEISDIKDYYNKISNEVTGIELSSEEEAKLKNTIEKMTKRLIEISENVSKKRKSAASELEVKIENELKDLGMPDTKIKISIKWEHNEAGDYSYKKENSNNIKKYVIHATGLDIIEFMLAASSKEILRPLKKTASGGEMSRIMLAIKKVIIDSDPVDTMVFDEVDSGVGGSIAEAVGKKLSSLAESSQVLVITHLHQIAGNSLDGTYHFKVIKNEEEGTKIFKLNQEARIQEVARMMSGEKITETALQHAKDLLEV